MKETAPFSLSALERIAKIIGETLMALWATRKHENEYWLLAFCYLPKANSKMQKHVWYLMLGIWNLKKRS